MRKTSRKTWGETGAYWIACACLAWAGHGAALANGAGGGAPLANVVQLSASGTVEVPQDWLTLVLATTREAPDAQTVQSQLKQALELGLAEARAAAQPGGLEVRTGAFGLSPRYGRDGKITGWQGRAELVLEGRDVARISGLAGRLGALSVSQVSFGLSREARMRVESEAHAQAIGLFRTRAMELTRAFGLTDYTLREVSVGSNDMVVQPRLRAMAMEARVPSMTETALPVEAGKAQVVVTVSGSVQMR